MAKKSKGAHTRKEGCYLPYKSTTNSKLQPGQEAEHAWVTPSVMLTYIKGNILPGSPQGCFRNENARWQSFVLRCLPQGVSISHTDSCTTDLIEMTKAKVQFLFSSPMASLIPQQIWGGYKGTQSYRMGKVLKIHEVVPIVTRPWYLMRAGQGSKYLVSIKS